MVVVPLVAMLSAAAPEVSVRWDAPRQCPSAADVRSQVGALVVAEAHGDAQADVVMDGAKYRLALVVETPHGRVERSLVADSCEAIASAAAVMIAVAVDPVERPQSDVPAAPSGPVADPTASSSVPSATPPSPVASPQVVPRLRRRPQSWIVDLGGGGAVGVLPGPHGLARVAVGPRWSRLEVLVTGTHRFSRVATHPDGGGAAVFVSSAGIAAGPIVRWGRTSAQLRAGIEAGAMVAIGRGLDDTRTATSPWVGASVEPGVAIAVVPWLAVTASAAFTVAVTRPQFAIDDGRILHQTSAVGASAGLGLQFRIPVRQSGPTRGPRR